MAISKLNTVFAKHHRIIFGVFSVIIIIAFTDFLTPGTGIVDAFRGTGRGSAVGEIFGKKVSYAELSEQIRLDMLAMQVFMNIPVNQAMREQLENQSFYNLANLAAAKQAKITVSDEEVGRFLRNSFRGENGKFNAEAYRNFVNNYLANEGFNEEDLNNAARQYLTLAKFQSAQAAAVTVTPDEVKLFYNMINEEFEVLSGNFKAADYEKSVKITDKALNDYFNANRAKYIIPARIQALVVEFPYSKYRSQAIKNVKDAQIKAFYEQNKQLFSTVKDGKVETPEFDKVKNQVRSSAIAAAAREMAVNAAQQFGVTAYESVGNVPAEQRLNTFKKQLAAAKLTAQDTGVFSADSKVAGKIKEAELVSELAGVFADVPISNAIPGKTAAYVGYVTKLIPSRNAELKEVKAQVTADFIKAEALRIARERAAEVIAKLNALPADNRVARAKAIKEPKFAAIKKFSLMSGSPELGFAGGAVANLQPGEIAEPVQTPTGTQVMMLVSRKVPAKAYTADPAMEGMFMNYKRSMAQMEYSNYLSKHCKKYAQSAEAQAVAE
ncbi:MAG: SurA N-terminal domain-containing protein [Lentisphaeria bacterium]|nr:SurA N-terminal domain-containing protein [Lentisphaeria bacterium]